MTYLQARQNVINAIRLIERALKTRDKREPGRKEKLESEERLERVIRRAFRKQKEIIQQWLELNYFERAGKKLPDTPDVDFDDEDINDLINVLFDAAKKGILLFGKGKPEIDYTLTNAEAAKWARRYTYNLVKDINSTTRSIIKEAIEAFVETPGMTIGDVMDRLPFDEDRARRIAITETTRSYAEGEMMAGRELMREFPDVRVIKIWYTNNDDRVCEICAPLDGMEVELEEGFTTEADKSEGLMSPPAHVNCRCWMETTTALAELD